MSLATRCPACQTVFRVVQDQLRVSEGWVRCGRCAEVFNALDHMVEVVKPVPPAQRPSVAAAVAAAVPAAAADASPPVPPSAAPLPAGTPDLADEPRWPAAAIPPMSFAPLPGPADVLDVEPQLPSGVVAAHAEIYEAMPEVPLPRGAPAEEDLDDGRADSPPHPFDGSDPAAFPAHAEANDPLAVVPAEDRAARPRHVDDSEEPAGQALVPPSDIAAAGAAAGGAPEAFGAAATAAAIEGAAESGAGPELPASGAAIEAAAAPLPSFLRQAQRAERWQRPAVRRALAAVLLLGGVGLLLQASLAYRDLVAARWPATRALLVPLCEALQCRIEPPRWIDAVVVDSTGLTKIDGNAYRLSVVMRNRSTLALALPAVDLMLTDTQGRLVARRTIGARELGATVPALPAQGELTLQATLQVAGGAVSGYTIELFYP